MVFDTLIRNGLIVDGTGAKPFPGDVGIKDGILHLGRKGGRGHGHGSLGGAIASGGVAAAPVLDVLDALVRVGDVGVAPRHVAEVVPVRPFVVVAGARTLRDGRERSAMPGPA